MPGPTDFFIEHGISAGGRPGVPFHPPTQGRLPSFRNGTRGVTPAKLPKYGTSPFEQTLPPKVNTSMAVYRISPQSGYQSHFPGLGPVYAVPLNPGAIAKGVVGATALPLAGYGALQAAEAFGADIPSFQFDVGIDIPIGPKTPDFQRTFSGADPWVQKWNEEAVFGETIQRHIASLPEVKIEGEPTLGSTFSPGIGIPGLTHAVKGGERLENLENIEVIPIEVVVAGGRQLFRVASETDFSAAGGLRVQPVTSDPSIGEFQDLFTLTRYIAETHGPAIAEAVTANIAESQLTGQTRQWVSDEIAAALGTQIAIIQGIPITPAIATGLEERGLPFMEYIGIDSPDDPRRRETPPPPTGRLDTAIDVPEVTISEPDLEDIGKSLTADCRLRWEEWIAEGADPLSDILEDTCFRTRQGRRAVARYLQLKARS